MSFAGRWLIVLGHILLPGKVLVQYSSGTFVASAPTEGSTLPAALDTMAVPWKCQCGTQCKGTAEYCSKCGLHWRQSCYPTYTAHSAPSDNGGRRKARSPRSRGDNGKGKATRPFSPRSRGRGKGGQAEAKGSEAATGKGTGAAPSAPATYMSQLPAAPSGPQLAQPTAPTAQDGVDKLPQTIQDILSSLASSKAELPPEIRAVLDVHMETNHQQTTKQLHRLVGQQSRAQKELLAIRKSRSLFVQEWSAYLDQLTQLLQKQLLQKEATLASMAESEQSWQEQLSTATRAIRQQTSTASTAEAVLSSEEEQDAMDAEVDLDAALEASKQAAVESSQQKEANLIHALQSASAASAVQAQQYRERTPRRRKSGEKEIEIKQEPGTEDAGGHDGTSHPGKAQ
ncbi:unnamed protein product [Symbiodinium sp. CCMP2592]|nr:unnamed protein product [Symbiodinium sp. CCMP2592]